VFLYDILIFFFFVYTGKTNTQGAHFVKIAFKGGWPSPPTPVFIDAAVTVIDLNKQTLKVFASLFFQFIYLSM
jgi:hypothetical protein